MIVVHLSPNLQSYNSQHKSRIKDIIGYEQGTGIILLTSQTLAVRCHKGFLTKKNHYLNNMIFICVIVSH